MKTVNPDVVDQVPHLGQSSIKHRNILYLDITNLTASEAATQIVNCIHKMQNTNFINQTNIKQGT